MLGLCFSHGFWRFWRSKSEVSSLCLRGKSFTNWSCTLALCFSHVLNFTWGGPCPTMTSLWHQHWFIDGSNPQHPHQDPNSNTKADGWVSLPSWTQTEVTPVTSAFTVRRRNPKSHWVEFLKSGTKKHGVTATRIRLRPPCYPSLHMAVTPRTTSWPKIVAGVPAIINIFQVSERMVGEAKKHPPPPLKFISHIAKQNLRFTVPLGCKGSWENLLYWGLSCGT